MAHILARWAASASTAGVLLAALTSGASAQSFPLQCRGGPDMAIEARFELIIGGQTGTIIRVNFRAAGESGSTSEPGPGECTWIDRTLNDAEPTSFTMIAPNVGFSFDLGGDGRFREQDGDPVLILGGESVSERTGYGRVVTAVLRGQLFTVLVANNGRTLMVSGVQR
jgi:hypothetical protein